MKRLFFGFLFFALVGVTTISAQQKFGYVNTTVLLSNMPAVATMQTKLQEKSQQYQGQLQTKYGEYETKYSEVMELQQQGAMDAIMEKKINELQTMENTIKQLEETIQEELAAYEEQLLRPIEEKVMVAINKVAKDNGYTYVFDLAAGSLLVQPEGDNLTGMVRTHMGF